MATRLQADEPDKQSKWADIDDEEDDWAPDTVEWMDGTKSTLQSAETPPPPPADSRPQLARQDTENSTKQPDTLEQRPSLNSGPGKTILKPGARTLTSQSSHTKPGLNLKKAPEISSGPINPPSQGPTKSPWAQLPPIDKVSPIAFVPPVPPPQLPFQSQPEEVARIESPPPVQSPAREIGPDDFNRSVRDSDRGSRELFDSKSGKYEPVRGPRRSSVRNDGAFRPPSVLRRPSQSGQSAASDAQPSQGWRRFANHEPRSWGRRGSSAITDESNGADIATDGKAEGRSPWETAKGVAGADSPEQPQGHSQSRVDPISGGRPDPSGQRSENSFMSYEQGMSSHVREALQRKKEKQEQEAREEEAKKKRLEAKLASLPPVPSKPEEKAREPGGEEKAGHVNQKGELPETRPPGPLSPLLATTKLELPAPGKSPIARPDDVMKSPAVDSTIGKADEYPKSPLKHFEPLASQPSSIAQYDKPHAPSAPPNHPPQSLSQFSLDAASQQSHPLPKSLSDGAATAAPRPQELFGATGTQRMPSFERQARSWNTAPTNARPSASWTSSGISTHTPSGTSVWGPPSNDKTLGNGAFGSEVQRLPSIPYPPSHPPERSSHGPIAPPSSSPRPSVQVNSPTPNIPPDSSQAAFAMAPAGLAAQKPKRQPNSGPFGDAAARIPSVYKSGSIKVDYSAARKAWNEASNAIAKQDSDFSEKGRRDAEEARRAPDFSFKQSFKQINSDPSLDRSSLAGSTPREPRIVSLSDGFNPSTIAHLAPGPKQNMPITTGHLQNPATKGSRFFGASADRNQSSQTTQSTTGLLEEDQAITGPSVVEMQSLFSGQTSKNPMVKLPAPPVPVKLPPPSAYNPESLAEAQKELPAVMPVRQKPFNRGPQPLADQAEWHDRFKSQFTRSGDRQDHQKGFFTGQSQNERQNQDRFAALLGRPALTSPDPKGQPKGVVPSSRALMDEHVSRSTATVSLPGVTRASPISVESYTLPNSEPNTKPSDEELWDQPEHGSTPKVCMAKPRPEWTPFIADRNTPSMAWNRGYAEERKPLFVHARPVLDTEKTSTVIIHMFDKPMITKQVMQKPASSFRNNYYGGPRKFDSRKPKIQKKFGENNASAMATENPKSTASTAKALTFKENPEAPKARDSKWPKPPKGPRKVRIDETPKASSEPEKPLQSKTTQPTTQPPKKLNSILRSKPAEKETSAFTKGRFEALGDAQMA